MRILSVGNIACDILVSPFDAPPVQKRKLLKDVSLFAGGDALNAAIDLAILGQEVCLVGRVGKDDFGWKIRKTLAEFPAINTQYLVDIDDTPTSTSVSTIMPNGERRAAYRAGCNETLTLSDIPEAMIHWSDHVHLGSAMRLSAMDGEGTRELFKKARASGKSTSMDLVVDLDEIWLGKIQDALQYCDIFLPSHYEVREVCRLEDPLAMKEFFRPYGLKVFGVKMGSRGVFITDYRQDIFMPSVTVQKPVDTLGAGDAFMATFIAAYLNRLPLEICTSMASHASCHVISRFGPTTGMKSFDHLHHEALTHCERSNSGQPDA